MLNDLVAKAASRKPLAAFIAEESEERLERSLSLFDLVCVGVGGTLGSGIFVLTGLISHEYAGPGVVYSWLIAGVCTLFSAMAYAEMASRIPSCGSAYAYAYCALGELPAFLAAFFMTLEYGISGAAIARSWGNKMSYWLESLGLEVPLLVHLEERYSLNIYAALLHLLCVIILLMGVKVGKLVVNLFTILKIMLVLFMTIVGFCYFTASNVQNMSPFGVTGILRGSSAAFFGLLGYDEVCILSAEARDPHHTLPYAVFGTIFISSLFSTLASLALVGMLPFAVIDPENGYSSAFRQLNVVWAQHIVSAGEIVTLPLVVLVSFLAQPRLLFEMSVDRLIPQMFSEIDSKGNLSKGITACGAVLTIVALFIPFNYLDDMISAGVLLSFNITNSSLIATRRGDSGDSFHCRRLLLLFNTLALATSALWTTFGNSMSGALLSFVFFLSSTLVAIVIDRKCPEKEDAAKIDQFRVPLVPYFPCLAILLNSFMIGQLSASGIYITLVYIVFVLSLYWFLSLGVSRGDAVWRSLPRELDQYEIIGNAAEDLE